MNTRITIQAAYALCFGLVAAATAHTYEYALPVLLILAACAAVLVRRIDLRSIAAFVPAVMLMMPAGGPSLLLRLLGVVGVVVMFELEAVLLRHRSEHGWAILKPSAVPLTALAVSSVLAYGLYTTGFQLPAWSAVMSLVPLLLLFLRLGSDRSDTQ
jgi:hypothetical protein